MGKIKKQKHQNSSSDARRSGGKEECSLMGGNFSFGTKTTDAISNPILNKNDHSTKIARKRMLIFKGQNMKKKLKRHLRHEFFITEMNTAMEKEKPPSKAPNNFEELSKASIQFEDGSRSPPTILHSLIQDIDDLTLPLFASHATNSSRISGKEEGVKSEPHTIEISKSQKREKYNIQTPEFFKRPSEIAIDHMEDSTPSLFTSSVIHAAKISGQKKEVKKKVHKKGIPKSGKRRKSMLQDLAAFQSVLNDPRYQADPAGSISSIIQSRMLQEGD